MVTAATLVNAKADASLDKTKTPDSADNRSNNFQDLYSFIWQNGENDTIKEGLASSVGLTGTPPVRGRDVTVNGPDRQNYRECSIVLSDKFPTGHPVHVYFDRDIMTKHTLTSYWYRMNLDGKLEMATVTVGKMDGHGNAVQGSGVMTQKDIQSSKVKKAFRAEMDYWTNDWLKTQKLLAAKSALEKATDSSAPAKKP
jgi:hypothetical protein